MKAVRIHEYGSVDVLKMEEVPLPELQPDDLLIKVYAAAVNPIDWKVREGKLQSRNLHHLPLIPGWDVSGVVERIGPRVQHFKPGDQVFSRPSPARNGSYAEYIAVKEDEVALKPGNISHVQAAAVPLAGLTAWEGLVTTANIQSEQKILIHGASGGVGSIAIQLGKIYGCYVSGTTSEKNIDFVKNLGANQVIDYKSQDFTQILSDLDVVFDTIGGETREKSYQVLKEGGILVSIINPPDEEKAKQFHVRTGYFFVESSGKKLSTLAHLINTGKLKPVVGKVFHFTEREVREAQQLSQSGHAVGKIVFKIREE